MTPDDVAKKAEELIAGLCAIPVEELIQCARGNLQATRMTRLSKDHPEGVAEPDFGVRQKALEWISAQRGASAVAPRKPVETAKPDGAGKPEPGALIRGKGKA
jgi:hypothetical protein